MNATNTKIWFLFLAAVCMFSVGCASTLTQEQRTSQVQNGLAMCKDQARYTVEQATGKKQADWGRYEQRLYAELTYRLVGAYLDGLHRTAAENSTRAYRAPEPSYYGGSTQSDYGSGTILGPNGKVSTYFRNPGGGVILGGDGSITNVIGN